MENTIVPTDLVPLKTAILKATGRRVHSTTAVRWATQGIHGICLKTWRVGNRRFASPTEVAEFVRATTAAANGETTVQA